jgi:flagellum-specific peptidoglycan hydrolase FlgJ
VSVHSAAKPWWQQATALVTVSAGGMITGFTFAPGAAATMTSPTGMPVHLMALEKAATSAHTGDASLSSDGALRSAIVNVAKYYLQLAKTRSPAQMEALIWGKDSLDGADHGPSCAAFASLTLELGAQAVGQQSWVTGGSTYPWPVHDWADPRVDPNPDSPGITSVLTDAETHGRWHALGDGYQPQPGDWVLFDEHVEVVTGYHDGVLDTIGADSLPGYTVNAHSFGGSLASHGIAGFVDNGHLAASTASAGQAPAQQHAAAQQSVGQGKQGRQGEASNRPRPNQQSQQGQSRQRQAVQPQPGSAAIPGAAAPQQPAAAQASGSKASGSPASGPTSSASGKTSGASGSRASGSAGGAASGPSADPQLPRNQEPAAQSQPAQAPATPTASIPGLASTGAPTASTAPAADSAVIPGLAPAGTAVSQPGAAHSGSSQGGSAGAKYTQHTPQSSAPTPATKTQQAFISAVAPGAIAAQQRYGVPASVTIAQAIDESAWGTSKLATADHNLFGIKGTGPAGAADYQTQEFIDGRWETITAAFRAYHNIAESISDHAELLATSGYYTRAMADRSVPDAFANDLTGIYATDPDYGSNLIATMKLYDLYRYDTSSSSVTQQSAPPAQAAPQHTSTGPGASTSQGATATHSAAPSAPAVAPSVTPAPDHTGTPTPTPSAPTATPSASTTQAPSQQNTPSHQNTPTRPSPPSYRSTRSQGRTAGRGSANIPGLVSPMIPAKTAARYTTQLPAAVTTAYFTSAKMPLARAEQLYRDVAGQAGISWKLLATCDWMQCQAQPRYSPVHGEKLGAVNRDGSVYTTKSEALTQCAADMIALAGAVYGIDLTVPRPMSVRTLAEVFAAFRWGGLLKKHGVSAMEFPYSVAGLTEYHAKMHWPAVHEPNAPDKPGGKFKQPFGAVPVVLSLKYPATV